MRRQGRAGTIGIFLWLLLVAVMGFSLDLWGQEETSAESPAGLTDAAPNNSASKRISQFWLEMRYGLRMELERRFRLHEVEIQGNFRQPSERYLKHLFAGGQSWVWDALRPSFFTVLQADPWCESYKVRWQFYPLVIKVKIEEAQPWLVVEVGSESWLVSQKGRLLEPLEGIQEPELVLEASRLPRLVGVDDGHRAEVSTSAQADVRYHYAIEQLRLLELGGGMPFPVETIKLLGDEGLEFHPIRSDRDPVVLLRLSSFEDAQSRVKQLRTVLADLSRRGESAQTIDLRFEGQAVLPNHEAAAVAEESTHSKTAHARVKR